MESVQASQNGLTAEMEEFYSLLSADWMKGFYDGMAGFVGWINAGTDSMEGMNLVIPLVAAAVIGFTVALNGAASAAGVSALSLSGLWTVMQAHPIALAVTAFAVLAGLMTGISSVTQGTSADIGKAMEDMNDDITKLNTVQKEFADNGRYIEDLKQRYIELSGKTTLTTTEQEEQKKVLDEISSISPALAEAIRTTSGAFGAQTEIVRGLNAELAENYQQGLLASQKIARGSFEAISAAVVAYNSEKTKQSTISAGVEDYDLFKKKNYTYSDGAYRDNDGTALPEEDMFDEKDFDIDFNQPNAKKDSLNDMLFDFDFGDAVEDESKASDSKAEEDDIDLNDLFG